MQPREKIHHDPKYARCHTHKRKMMENPRLDLPWPGPSRVHSGPNGPNGPNVQWSSNSRGRVPSTPPRVPSGPRLDWSGPTPRLGFTKILQWGRGGGGTLSSRWGGSNIVVQTLLQTGYLPEQPQTSYDPKCAHCHMHTHTHKMILRSKMCTAPQENAGS